MAALAPIAADGICLVLNAKKTRERERVCENTKRRNRAVARHCDAHEAGEALSWIGAIGSTEPVVEAVEAAT